MTIPLVQNGKSTYQIVIAEKPETNGRVRQAAETLQHFVEQASGARLPIVEEHSYNATAPAVFLGKSERARKADPKIDALTGWNCKAEIIGRDIYLAGDDTPVGSRTATGAVNQKNAYHGTLKAVTLFLEDQVGVRFLMPGPNGSSVPRSANIEVAGDYSKSFAPHFQYVIGRDPGDIVYSAANNFFNTPIVKSYGGHSYLEAVPQSKYWDTHPEYFYLKDGKRTKSPFGHLCISNPDVRRLMIEEMEREFDLGYKWVELAQTDAYEPCECSECAKISADPKERLWIFHRDLAQEMKKRRPNGKVMIIAYGPTMNPPTTFDKFPDNVVIQTTRYSPKELSQWDKFNVAMTAYIYNWEGYFPLGLSPVRHAAYGADEIKLFVEKNVQGIYLCGAFSLPGLEGPAYYVFGRTMGDPTLNAVDIEDEYYRSGFGKAYEPMKAFFNRLHSKLEVYSEFHAPMHYTDSTLDWKTVFRTPETVQTYFYPPEHLAALQKELDAAKAAEPTGPVAERLRLIQLEFDYTKSVANIFHLYRAYQVHPSVATFELVAKAVDARNAMLHSWYNEDGTFRSFGGWPKFFLGRKESEIKLMRGRSQLTQPFDWDTADLRKRKVLPAVSGQPERIYNPMDP